MSEEERRSKDAAAGQSEPPRRSWRDDAETDYAETSPDHSPQLLVHSRRGSTVGPIETEALQWHDQLRQTEVGRTALRRFSELNCELNTLQNQLLSAETKKERKALRQQVQQLDSQIAEAHTLAKVSADQAHMPRSTLLVQDSGKLPASADKGSTPPSSTPTTSTPPSSTPLSAVVSPQQETEQQLQQQSRRQHPRRTFGCPSNIRPDNRTATQRTHLSSVMPVDQLPSAITSYARARRQGAAAQIICKDDDAVAGDSPYRRYLHKKSRCGSRDARHKANAHQVRRKTAQHLHQTADTIPPAMSMLTQAAGRQVTNSTLEPGMFAELVMSNLAWSHRSH